MTLGLDFCSSLSSSERLLQIPRLPRSVWHFDGTLQHLGCGRQSGSRLCMSTSHSSSPRSYSYFIPFQRTFCPALFTSLHSESVIRVHERTFRHTARFGRMKSITDRDVRDASCHPHSVPEGDVPGIELFLSRRSAMLACASRFQGSIYATTPELHGGSRTGGIIYSATQDST